MHLYAALVPPSEAVGQVHAVLAGVAPVADPPTEVRRGRLRLRRRSEPVLPADPMLEPEPPEAVHLVVARFGNLALDDATRLADTLGREASSWASPRLRLCGGVAPEPGGDRVVSVRLAGDVEGAAALAGQVNRVAQALHLYVDRRAFAPRLAVATLTDATSRAYLAALMAALEEFEGDLFWQNTVSLLTPAHGGPGRPLLRTHRDLVLGPAAL